MHRETGYLQFVLWMIFLKGKAVQKWKSLIADLFPTHHVPLSPCSHPSSIWLVVGIWKVVHFANLYLALTSA